MNKTEFINAVAEKEGIEKKCAEKAVNAVFATIAQELAKGEKIPLVGFGTFEVTERAAREGINPATGAKITIPASKVPKFKISQALKNKVAGK